jgi:hypothetical protein
MGPSRPKKPPRSLASPKLANRDRFECRQRPRSSLSRHLLANSAGKCILDMLGVFAKAKTNLRRERQLDGIAKAKAYQSGSGWRTRTRGPLFCSKRCRALAAGSLTRLDTRDELRRVEDLAFAAGRGPDPASKDSTGALTDAEIPQDPLQ